MLLRDAHDRRYRLEFRYGLLSPADPRRTVTAWLYPLVLGSERPPRDQRSGAPLQAAMVGMALCSTQDQFVREAGREIALQRALGGVQQLAPPGDAAALLRCWRGRYASVDSGTAREHVQGQPVPLGTTAAWELS